LKNIDKERNDMTIELKDHLVYSHYVQSLTTFKTTAYHQFI